MSFNTPNDIALPSGWLEQYDPTTGRNFYVDTNVAPPRVTWVHPYEDQEYLAAHPDAMRRVKERLAAPVELGSDGGRRNSFGGTSSTPVPDPSLRSARPPHKQGFLEKLKDKAMSSMEAREERKRREAAAWQQRINAGAPTQYTAPAGYPAQYPQQTFGRTYPGVMGPMSGFGASRRHGFGGGSALPLMGGLAGGLLLGDMLDGGIGGGGGFDGGGFGGGGFDGGGFGGF